NRPATFRPRAAYAQETSDRRVLPDPTRSLVAVDLRHHTGSAAGRAVLSGIPVPGACAAVWSVGGHHSDGLGFCRDSCFAADVLLGTGAGDFSGRASAYRGSGL